MSLELVMEAVRINQPIGGDSTQTIVESDIIVPDTKPDISRILLLDGDVFVNSAEVAPDALLINGMVRYKILYVSDDPEQLIKSINTATSFQYSMDIPNARQGMQYRVKCDIEHMEYELINSRKINVKAIVSLAGRVNSQEEQYIAQDIDGVEEVQILRSKALVNSYIGADSEVCHVNEVLDIPTGKPSILEILRNDVKITGKEYRQLEDRLIVNGELSVSTLYIGDDEVKSIQTMEHEIPFSQSIELPGADESSFSNVELALRDAVFEAWEDNDGELRQLKCEVSVDVFAECFCKKELELVEDAYSPFVRLELEKKQISMEELAAEVKSQAVIKEIIETDSEAPNISEIFNILGKLYLSNSSVMDDRVSIEGVIGCNVLYLSDNPEEPVCCISREVPFKQVLDVRGAREGMRPDVEMNIEHINYNVISSGEIEVRFVIGFINRVNKTVGIPVVEKAAEEPLDEKRLENRPSVIIYFAQADDTLWNVAKKYGTTVDRLRKDNNLENTDTLAPGTQILIPKRL